MLHVPFGTAVFWISRCLSFLHAQRKIRKGKEADKCIQRTELRFS